MNHRFIYFIAIYLYSTDLYSKEAEFIVTLKDFWQSVFQFSCYFCGVLFLSKTLGLFCCK